MTYTYAKVTKNGVPQMRLAYWNEPPFEIEIEYVTVGCSMEWPEMEQIRDLCERWLARGYGLPLTVTRESNTYVIREHSKEEIER